MKLREVHRVMTAIHIQLLRITVEQEGCEHDSLSVEMTNHC